MMNFSFRRAWLITGILLSMIFAGSQLAVAAEEGAPASEATSSPPSSTAPGMTEAEANEVDHWTCGMHLFVKQSGPGTCPIPGCGMPLKPVTKGQIASGEIMVDEVRRQLIGVRTAPVERAALTLRVHGYGVVMVDESRLTDINLKVGGWITSLKADAVGATVTKGATLFELYSPDLYAAQKEFLATKAAVGDHAGRDSVRSAARERLKLLDLGEAQIDRLANGGDPQLTSPIVSPIDGYVLRKEVVQGSAVQAGAAIMRLAPFDPVWLVADVVERDAPLLAVGQEATVTLPSQPSVILHGHVSFIYPELRDLTRAAQVRIEIANPDHVLRPNQYAGVDIAVDRGERLLVPKEAVLYAGERRLVFVDLGEGRLRPQAITIGSSNDDQAEVLDGLKVGDVVVTSGHFLLSAESRTLSAEAFWGAPHVHH